MKPVSIGRRGFGALVLPLLGAPVLASCGSSPEPVLYTLVVPPGPVLPRGPRIVQVRDVGLPGYLDRREIVRSQDDFRLDVRANSWWGEPMGELLGRVLVMALTQRLPESQVYSEKGSITTDPYAIVAINFQRLDADRAGTVILMAQVAIQFNRPTRSASRNFSITRQVATPDTPGHVAATSDAVGELANGIAAMLQ